MTELSKVSRLQISLTKNAHFYFQADNSTPLALLNMQMIMSCDKYSSIKNVVLHAGLQTIFIGSIM